MVIEPDMAHGSEMPEFWHHCEAEIGLMSGVLMARLKSGENMFKDSHAFVLSFLCIGFANAAPADYVEKNRCHCHDMVQHLVSV